MIQLNATSFLIFQALNRNIQKICGGRVVKIWKVVGVEELTVETGCKIISDSFLFESSSSLFGETIQVNIREVNASLLFDSDDLSTIVQMDAAALDALRRVGSREGIRIQDISEQLRSDVRNKIYAFGILSFACAVVAVILCLCLLRCSWVKSMKLRLFFVSPRSPPQQHPHPEQIPLNDVHN